MREEEREKIDSFSECMVDKIERDKDNIDILMWWRHKEGK